MIHIRHMDDWMGLYVDGKLEYEGHSIDEYWLLTTLQKYDLLKTGWKIIDDYGKVELGNYPQNEEDIEKELERLNDS